MSVASSAASRCCSPSSCSCATSGGDDLAPYHVKEIYYTLQGEGAQTGRPAVFCRFSNCNLWSGHESDRPTAICDFCDTDFVGTDGPLGGDYASSESLVDAVASLWPTAAGDDHRFVVCTGGEPLLQLDDTLIEQFHRQRFFVAVETNGTIPAPANLDWICVSPKAGAKWTQTSGDEIKLVFPQPGAMPEQFATGTFDHWFLQPMDGPHRAENTRRAAEYCLNHPQWKLSVQTHKDIGLP